MGLCSFSIAYYCTFYFLQAILLKRIQEEQSRIHLPEKWLVKMAIGNVYLQEGNTFAKSIWLHLVEKIAKYLAPIIELLDHQGGLEHSMMTQSWKYSIYVHFAQSKEIQSLQQISVEG